MLDRNEYHGWMVFDNLDENDGNYLVDYAFHIL